MAATETPMRCACRHSLAALSALFASLAAAAIVAGRRCLEGGGRLSDDTWTCETAPGVVASLWTLVTPGVLALAALVVGVPAYFAVSALARRASRA